MSEAIVDILKELPETTQILDFTNATFFENTGTGKTDIGIILTYLDDNFQWTFFEDYPFETNEAIFYVLINTLNRLCEYGKWYAIIDKDNPFETYIAYDLSLPKSIFTSSNGTIKKEILS